MKILLNRRSAHCEMIFATLFLLLLLACQAPPKPAVQNLPVEKDGPIPPPPEPRITLGPGDNLEVKFFNTPELNETETVRPDGKIDLQLIGEVDVRGKTPAEIREELVRAYSADLRKPRINVIVRSLNERRVYVGGEVKNPSLLPLPGSLTALEAIMQAGGFNLDKAEVSNVVVIHERGGRHFGTVLNFKDSLGGGEAASYYLEPRDIVYVPRTVIANVDLWISQHIYQILPSMSLYIYPSTVGVGLSTPR